MTAAEAEPARPPKQEKLPASEEVAEVAPGVLRLQLPISLPGLGHVNCYAMEDARGIALVDPGLPGRASWAALTARLKAAGLPLGRVHTVVVTHSHPDHYGGAERVAGASGAAIAASRHFQTWSGRPCLHAHEDDDEHDHDDSADLGPPWTRPTPWGGPAYQVPFKRRLAYGALGKILRNRWSPPAPTHCVRDGEVLLLAGRDWVARHTPGHTVDHLCLEDQAEGLLLSGDHVLPTITPHISGVGTDPDPVASYVASLEAVAALDGVRTVLPAHGQPFDDLAGRVAEIIDHHHTRLDRLVVAAGEWTPVAELSHAIFPPRSWSSMAESEAYAHLEHLRLLGSVDQRRSGELLEYRART